MLEAVFYARFHPERGPSVIHQYPPTAIKAPLGHEHETLVEWRDIVSYIIPPYDICNQPLAICSNGHRILGYPISLEHEDYDRNRFTFNVCFVLPEEEDAHPWTQIIRKTAHFFTEIEWHDCMLQKEELLNGLKLAGEEGYPVEDVNGGVVYGVLQSIVKDLNAYGETCIRVNSVRVLNLRPEFPKEFAKDSPTKIRAWDVPLLVRTVPIRSEWTWDLTLQRIHSFIDGVKHVEKIAELADVELKLVKRAIKELVHHGRAMLLDIFHFQAIYTCTDEIVYFLQDLDLQDECRRYVAVPPAKETREGRPQSNNGDLTSHIPSREHVAQLYCSLNPGLQLQEFCLTHNDELAGVDIRRLITFGIIRGIVRRVHKYALAMEHRPVSPVSTRSNQRSIGSVARSNGARSKPKSNDDDEAVKEFDRAWRKAALSSGWATPPSGPHPSSLGKSFKSADRVRSEEDERLRSYLDGNHCMDQICVEMHMSEKKVLERVRSGRLGEVILFNK